MRKRRRSRLGLSLLELLVVVSLMGIFSSAAFMRFGRDVFGDSGARSQARKLSLPEYDLVSVTGKAHAQTFTVTCTVNELSQTTEGESTSRRAAEQEAARNMLGRLSGERS